MTALMCDSTGSELLIVLKHNDEVYKECFTGKTGHSPLIMRLVDSVLKSAGIKTDDVDVFAACVGPGSFTGVRIGVATVKGLAFNDNVPCVSVSTLEAIACNFLDEDCIVCSVMDARRMQFYNALFEIKNGKAVRLCEDRAISIDDLKNDLKKYEKVIIAGDGARLCYDNLGIDNIILAPEDKRYQCGQGVALAAENKEKISAAALMPVYLRLSQAERELKLKKNDKEN